VGCESGTGADLLKSDHDRVGSALPGFVEFDAHLVLARLGLTVRLHLRSDCTIARPAQFRKQAAD
jgi:hypothetical protein